MGIALGLVSQGFNCGLTGTALDNNGTNCGSTDTALVSQYFNCGLTVTALKVVDDEFDVGRTVTVTLFDSQDCEAKCAALS